MAVDLTTRTRAFALRVVRLFGALPETTEGQVLGKQLLRCGTSVGAHYRESVRARSTAEFITKIEVGLAELEEAMYWLELLIDAQIVPTPKLAPLKSEANELIAILVTCAKNAKQRRRDEG
jgi:four helix bundle protein